MSELTLSLQVRVKFVVALKGQNIVAQGGGDARKGSRRLVVWATMLGPFRQRREGLWCWEVGEFDRSRSHKTSGHFLKPEFLRIRLRKNASRRCPSGQRLHSKLIAEVALSIFYQVAKYRESIPSAGT